MLDGIPRGGRRRPIPPRVGSARGVGGMAFRGTGGIDRAARDKCGGGERDGPETDHDYGRCWYFGPAALVIDFVRLRREAKATKLVHGVEMSGRLVMGCSINKLSSFYAKVLSRGLFGNW